MHDTKCDCLEHTAAFGELVDSSDSDRESHCSGVPLADDFCTRILRIYPSQVMEDEHITWDHHCFAQHSSCGKSGKYQPCQFYLKIKSCFVLLFLLAWNAHIMQNSKTATMTTSQSPIAAATTFLASIFLLAIARVGTANSQPVTSKLFVNVS